MDPQVEENLRSHPIVAKVIAGFEKKNPDITVKQLNIPYA